MVKLFALARNLRAFLILINDPTQTAKVFNVADSSSYKDDPNHQRALARLKANPLTLQMYEEDYNPAWPAVEEMLRYPAGTLGHELGKHLHSNNLTPNFYTLQKDANIQSYIIDRSRKIHDCMHVLTGFNTSVAEEIGLQAFSMIQFRSPITTALLAAGLIHGLVRNKEIFDDILESVYRGVLMARHCKPLISVRFEDRLHEPVEDIRRDVGMVDHHRVVA